jgi:hypothetical protein
VIKFRSPAEAKNFSSSLCVQTISEALPASYPIVRESFVGVKRGRGVTLTTHPHLVPRSRMNSRYTSFPLCSLHGGSRTALLSKHSSKEVVPSVSIRSRNLRWEAAKVCRATDDDDDDDSEIMKLLIHYGCIPAHRFSSICCCDTSYLSIYA